MQKLSSFGRGKKFRPKKSLTSLLHAALQLYIPLIQQCSYISGMVKLISHINNIDTSQNVQI